MAEQELFCFGEEMLRKKLYEVDYTARRIRKEVEMFEFPELAIKLQEKEEEEND